jgi:ribosome-associated protein
MADAHALHLANEAALAADSRRASHVVVLDVSPRLPLTDVFVLATGSSERQVGAIVEAVDERLARLGARLERQEGRGAGRWVLLDYGEVVVHVMHQEDRDYYALDKLWKDCPLVEVPELLGPEPALAVGA